MKGSMKKVHALCVMGLLSIGGAYPVAVQADSSSLAVQIAAEAAAGVVESGLTGQALTLELAQITAEATLLAPGDAAAIAAAVTAVNPASAPNIAAAAAAVNPGASAQIQSSVTAANPLDASAIQVALATLPPTPVLGEAVVNAIATQAGVIIQSYESAVAGCGGNSTCITNAGNQALQQAGTGAQQQEIIKIATSQVPGFPASPN